MSHCSHVSRSPELSDEDLERYLLGRIQHQTEFAHVENVVFDEFDQELEWRGLRLARYADDSNIDVRSRRTG
jgi:hypothetical protein